MKPTPRTGDVRPERSDRSGRALLAVAGLFAISGMTLGTIALVPDSSDDLTLEVTTATAVTSPITVPPLPLAIPDPAPPDPTGAAGVDRAARAPTTDPAVELSPLAELLGVEGSAIPPAVEPRVRPRSVTIDDIELWGPVRDVGLEEDGQLEIPDETEIGWYRYGSSPGRPGATVLAAHVSWNETVGPFFRLGELEPGAQVRVRLDDESIRTYEIVERTMYDKDELPRDRIWRTTGDETLVLITCGGSFNPDIRRYRQNIVVFAVPVA